MACRGIVLTPKPPRQHSPNSWEIFGSSPASPSERSPSSAPLRRCPLSAFAAPRPAPPVVDYRIEVALEPESENAEGTGSVSSGAIPRTTRSASSGSTCTSTRSRRPVHVHAGVGRTAARDNAGQKAEDWGWIDVSSIRRIAGAELRPGARFIQPDGNDPEDQTVLSVPLPAPVPPRGEITLDITFDAKLPKIFARTGFVRDYFLVGQWFPKLGVYEPAGMRGPRPGRLERPCAPRQLRVLRRLRQLRRVHDRAVAVRRRRDRKARRGNADRRKDDAIATRRTTSTTSPGPPTRGSRSRSSLSIPRATSRRAGPLAPPGSSGCREAEIALKPVACRLLMQPGPRGRARALPARGEGVHRLLRPLVRGLSVRDADDRGPSRRRHRVGRHGVPDLLHGRRRAIPF